MARQKTLEGFGPLSDAEQHLVDACIAGQRCVLGDGKRPEGTSVERSIRADLLRFLILGGGEDCEVHEWGVYLQGAYIVDQLDLGFATAKGPTGLLRCAFEHKISALGARFEFLNLGGSSCPGLFTQGIKVAGDVFLNAGFHATELVSLSGSTIGGQLNCRNGIFKNAGGIALNAHSAQVAGGVFLNSGFQATGRVTLTGAKIGGPLDCGTGTFENEQGDALDAESAQVTGTVFLDNGFRAKGEVSLSGASIGGQLSCRKGTFENERGSALIAQGLKVRTELIWQVVTTPAGLFDFNSAKVGTLFDDPDSWPGSKNDDRLVLDGMTYERLGASFQNVDERLDWLARGTIWKGNFYPQPYSQLAKVYREMGHHGDARLVLFEQERLIRLFQRKRLWAEKISLRSNIGVAVWWCLLFLWDGLLRLGVGYGYRAIRSVAILWVLGTIAAFLASETWNEGSFAPNSDVVLVSQEWTDRMDLDCVPEALAECLANPADDWSSKSGPGLDWDSFNAWGYAADLVIPILDLGQTDAWAPSKDRGPWGKHLWYGRWLLAAAGWLVAGLGAAAITGIIKRE